MHIFFFFCFLCYNLLDYVRFSLGITLAKLRKICKLIQHKSIEVFAKNCLPNFYNKTPKIGVNVAICLKILEITGNNHHILRNLHLHTRLFAH